jgi:hypothetical protein
MATQTDGIGEPHRYLLSRSSLDEYLDFVSDYSLTTENRNRKTHTDAWNAAAEKMTRLRVSEADRADRELRSPLPASLRSLVALVESDPYFRQSFDDTTWEIALVNLDGVIASQKLVSARHVGRLQQKLEPRLSEEELFRFCLPYDRKPPSHRFSRIDGDEFAFTSESNDLRFLDAVPLRPEQISGYHPVGPIAGVIALVVGFGSNYLNVIRANDRYILNNGNHRACALYQAGYRKVPCVVQTIVQAAEFSAHVPRVIQRNPDFYLSEPRPPLIADYFDSVLSREFPIGLTGKEVRISYKIDEKDIPY